MDSKQGRTVLISINVALGIVFLLFPRLAMRMHGIDPDHNPGAAYPCRYLGANSLLVAVMLADDGARGALIKHIPTLAATDVGANVLAIGSGEVPKRVGILGALTSAAVVVLGLLSKDKG